MGNTTLPQCGQCCQSDTSKDEVYDGKPIEPPPLNENYFVDYQELAASVESPLNSTRFRSVVSVASSVKTTESCLSIYNASPKCGQHRNLDTFCTLGNGADRKEAPLGHPLRAVTVFHLSTSLLEQVRQAALRLESTVSEIENAVILRKGENEMCPRDGSIGAAYVDCIHSVDEVGHAGYMLSYTWAYAIGDIVDSLVMFSRTATLNPKLMNVWICCFWVNQHRVQASRKAGREIPFAEFRETFGSCVSKIGRLLALMTPWEQPTYLTRAWCVFEMYTGISTQCQVTVLMPPRQAERLCTALKAGTCNVHSVWHVLAGVEIEAAKASFNSDKENILQLIREESTTEEVNAAVCSYLKEWLITILTQHANTLIQQKLSTPRANTDVPPSDNEVVTICRVVAPIIRSSGHFDDAKTLLQACAEAITDKIERARLQLVLGNTELKRARLDEAWDAFGSAWTSLLEAGAENSDVAAAVLNSMAATKRKQGNLSEALTSALQAKEIYAKLGTLETTEDGLVLIGHLALIKELQGDIGSALETYEIVRTRQFAAGTLASANGLLILNSIGNARLQMGDLDGAMAAYTEATNIRVRLRSLNSPCAAEMFLGIGQVKLRQGDVEGAKTAFQTSKLTFEKMNITETASHQKLISLMQTLQQD